MTWVKFEKVVRGKGRKEGSFPLAKLFTKHSWKLEAGRGDYYLRKNNHLYIYIRINNNGNK